MPVIPSRRSVCSQASNALNRRRTRRDASTVLHTSSQLAADTVSLCKEQLVRIMHSQTCILHHLDNTREASLLHAASSTTRSPDAALTQDNLDTGLTVGNSRAPSQTSRSHWYLVDQKCSKRSGAERHKNWRDHLGIDDDRRLLHTISTHMYLYVTVMRSTPSGEYTCGDGASSYDVHVPSLFPRCMVHMTATVNGYHSAGTSRAKTLQAHFTRQTRCR
jgi:hypothetical protein